ncbi:MAG TPA: hypothetical protein DCY79_00960 [Planctomycetaceae bacterium]|nr:hypothetical protein [Planctomycetaceae bacterium]
MSHPATDYQWESQPAAWTLVQTVVEKLVTQEPVLADFAQRLLSETGTRLIDWIRLIRLPANSIYVPALIEAGFQPAPLPDGSCAYQNSLGMFPDFQTSAPGQPLPPEGQMVLNVDNVAACLAAHPWPNDRVYLAPQATDRPLAIVHLAAMDVIMRASEPAVGWNHPATACPRQRHRQAFQHRDRRHDGNVDGFALTVELIESAQRELGKDITCELFFACEREYWQSRNAAARVQKQRQDAFGLGWANHDHHTYRSSRTCFMPLIACLERLGLRCRERFYAGREAGWGAQVLECPVTGIIVFADVDLSPTEVASDFAHEPLEPRSQLGTVGMWCQLHGESFLQAGMHHLECQFAFDAARQQLADAGVDTMAPFTDFPFLKQAFTQGEMWPVDESRLRALVTTQAISSDQAEHFRTHGALGSHLEILERNDGYKGFNQTGISDIIQRTDPRHA